MSHPYKGPCSEILMCQRYVAVWLEFTRTAHLEALLGPQRELHLHVFPPCQIYKVRIHEGVVKSGQMAVKCLFGEVTLTVDCGGEN